MAGSSQITEIPCSIVWIGIAHTFRRPFGSGGCKAAECTRHPAAASVRARGGISWLWEGSECVARCVSANARLVPPDWGQRKHHRARQGPPCRLRRAEPPPRHRQGISSAPKEIVDLEAMRMDPEEEYTRLLELLPPTQSICIKPVADGCSTGAPPLPPKSTV